MSALAFEETFSKPTPLPNVGRTGTMQVAYFSARSRVRNYASGTPSSVDAQRGCFARRLLGTHLGHGETHAQHLLMESGSGVSGSLKLSKQTSETMADVLTDSVNKVTRQSSTSATHSSSLGKPRFFREVINPPLRFLLSPDLVCACVCLQWFVAPLQCGLPTRSIAIHGPMVPETLTKCEAHACLDVLSKLRQTLKKGQRSEMVRHPEIPKSGWGSVAEESAR